MSITEEVVTGEIVPYVPANAVEEYRPRIVMNPADAKEIDGQLRANMLAVLREDVDYGKIPGAGEKKNLLKPGAEKLLQWFGFGSESSEVKTEREDPDYPSGIADKARRIGVTYRTEVTKTVPGIGKVVIATCEGYAGYDEDRYYIPAEDAVRKAEEKERFWARKDNRAPNPAKWENAGEYRAPWNTLVKMAQKRAYVGAAIDATSAAGLFTQDMEAVAAEAGFGDFAATGRTAIEGLPQAVGKELNAWFTALNWPGPDAWDAEQWCKALIKAGEYSSEATFAKAGVTMQREGSPATPAREAREEAPEEHVPDAREGWAAEHLTVAKVFEYEAQGRTLWKLTAEKARARDITRDQAKQIQDAITARITHIKAEGAAMGPLDPEEEWASLVENLAEDEAGDTKAEIRAEVAADRIPAAHADLIIAAINIRLLDLAAEKAAA